MTAIARPVLDRRDELLGLRIGRFGWIALLAVLGAGCSASDNEGTTQEEELGGGWHLPAAVADIGSQVSIHYESPGAWNGGRGCSGKLRPGARALGREIMTRFGQVSSIGGYSCRQNTANRSNLSVHGTGKALDIFIPQEQSSRANSELGDPVANWLVVHATEIGVQYIIWNRTQWRANGSNTSRYGGPVPHIDHIHAEITEKAARLQMPFFNQLQSQGPVEEDQGLTSPNEQQPAAGDIAVFGQNGQNASDPNAPAGAESAPVQEGTPDPEGDSEPGEHDSLGTGVRDVGVTTDGSAQSKPIVGGCSVGPALPRRGAAGSGLALVVAAALVTRRRRRK